MQRSKTSPGRQRIVTIRRLTAPDTLAAVSHTVIIPARIRFFIVSTTSVLAALVFLFPLITVAFAQQAPEDLTQVRARAASGEPEAQNALGNAYTNGWLGLAQNHSEALVWYQRAAEQGFAPARFNLGLAYELGRGVSKDDTVAFQHYLKAAEQGFAAALFNVGNMYATGRGVRQDLFESNIWYRQAADKGVPEAQFNLGLAYESGRGVRQDEAQAAQWYRRAADRGFALAQYNLGLLLEDGRGVEKDEAAAARYYRAAAEQGLGTAQNNYGLMLNEGRGGLTRNPAEALLWLTLAVENGVEPLARDTVARTLSPEQMKEAAQLLTAAHTQRGSSAGSSAAAGDTATSRGSAPRLERQTVAPPDHTRMVDQLRDQVSRLANQLLAVTAEKSALEEKLAAERETRLAPPSPPGGRDGEVIARRLHDAEEEAIRLRHELASLQSKLRDVEGQAGESRQLTVRVRDLEQQLRQLRAAANPADEGSALASLQLQVKKLQGENRDLERWVESLEASVRNQPTNTSGDTPSADVANRLVETEQILASTKRALEAQLAREEKLKFENSLLTVRFQQTEELLRAQQGGGAKAEELVALNRELTSAREEIIRLKREKDGLTNVWVDEQRALQKAQARIATLEQELAQAWKGVEGAGPMVIAHPANELLPANPQAQRQELERLLREQENAAALLAISRRSLTATVEQTEELKAENNRLREELGLARSARPRSPADLAATSREDEDLIAALRTENQQLSARLAKVQGAIDQIVEVVRNGSPDPAPTGSLVGTDAPSGTGASLRFHTVTDGDSLSRISLKYYGTPARWEEIFQANSAELADSKKLRLGQRLVIP